MSAYELRIVKYNKRTKKETHFSLKKILEAIEISRKLRFVEKMYVSVDENGNEEVLEHGIEFNDYGTWELLCIYDIAFSKFYTFAPIYLENDLSKELIESIVIELGATLIGEEGEIYEIEKY